jgi:hypothetical protein
VAEERAVKVWLTTVAVALVTSGLLFVDALHATPADDFVLSGFGGVSFVVASLAFATVGTLVAARVPGNRIGPIFCVMGLILGVGNLLFQYADLALFIAPSLPAGEATAWLQNFGLPSCFGLLGVAVLLFPDGRLPSRRWRWVLVLAYAGIALTAIGYAFRPGVLDEPFEHVVNPLGIGGMFGLMDALSGVGWMLMGASVGLAAIGSGLRLRRAHGVERAQLKWLGLAAAVTGSAIIIDVVSYFVPVGGLNALRTVSLGLGFTAFPLTAGMAILRHRLYDIDVVINRALVYGALTATLGATYLGLVLLTGLTIGQSNVAIAISTLAVAALFRPARASIQAAVDRRFYRRRYDAQRTLAAFGAQLRHEVDFDAVQHALVGVVGQTVQPAHVSLWLPRNDSRTHGP